MTSRLPGCDNGRMDGGFFRRLGRPPLSDRLRAAEIREDLIEAADRTAFGRQCDDEVASLPALLRDDEVVQQLLEGRWRKATGLLVLTTRRIVFTAKGADPNAALIIDRAEVLAASGRLHRGLGTLTVTTRTGDHVIDQILGTQAETFAENTMQQPAPNRPPADPLVELAELRALHEAGAIGDAEFQVRKRQLFDQI